MTGDAWCFECGNHGFEDKVCPSCERPPRTLSLGRLDEDQVKEIESKFKMTCIPTNYHGVEWGPGTFWSFHPEYIDYSDGEKKFDPLDRVIKRMEWIYDMFLKKVIPHRSCIIVMPPHMGKQVWAYSCMQAALLAGHTVAPLFDTEEVAGFMGAGLRNPTYKLYGAMTLEEYIMCDIVFVTVTKTEQRKSAHNVIRELMDRRSRKGKPTFVISEFGLEELAGWDDTGYTLRLMDPNIKNENPFKVPMISTFREPEIQKRKKVYYAQPNKQATT